MSTSRQSITDDETIIASFGALGVVIATIRQIFGRQGKERS
jgi:hypothetical protein